MIFKTPLLNLFGASPDTLPYADSYLEIYLIGTISVQIALGMNQFVSAQGFAKTAMLTVCIGAALNIVLDPIFIFALDMGVRGAALATIMGMEKPPPSIFQTTSAYTEKEEVTALYPINPVSYTHLTLPTT